MGKEDFSVLHKVLINIFDERLCASADCHESFHLKAHE